MRYAVYAALVLIGNLSTHAQANPEIPPEIPAPKLHILTAIRTIPLGISPVVIGEQEVCDSSGNMFFDIGDQSGQKGPFLRVEPDGHSHAIYALPPSLAKNAWVHVKGAVAPGGSFYVYYVNFKNTAGHKLIHYQADGTVGRTITLDLPAYAFIENFVVQDSGVLYVRGYQDNKDEWEKPRPGFAVLLDDTGKVIKDFSKNTQPVDLKAQSEGVPEGDAVAGDDGRFYVLESSDVLVLNQGGDIERVLKFTKPDPSAYATRLDVSGGLVSIKLTSIGTPKEPNKITSRMLLLDGLTGELRDDFVFGPENSSRTVMCFRRDEGYSLFALDGKIMARDVVPIP